MQRRSIFVCGCLIVMGCFPLARAHACERAAATVVSNEGRVESQSGTDAWQAVAKEARLCPGDRLRTGENSRAAVVLDDHTLVRLDALTTLSITGAREQQGFWVELLQGMAHFMSRVPRRLNVSTPFVNAGVEGTEFSVWAGDAESLVAVREGKVAASNDNGRLLLGNGQAAVARAGQAPVIDITVKPLDAVQWALYYPPVLRFDESDFPAAPRVPWQDKLQTSLAAYHQGRVADALAQIEEVPGIESEPRVLLYRASLALSVGRSAKADADIERVLAMHLDDADALALKSVIAVTQNDASAALALAQKAVAAAPQASAPPLALSYALQAKFDLTGARNVIEQAVSRHLDSALLWARLSELRLMAADLEGAVAAAQRAQELTPGDAKAQSLLGFAQLLRLDTAAAKRAFEQAIERDPSAPLPHLGLGLALIRLGDLAQGRRELEIAATLDPNRALLRSYLGKAYYEEKRDELAADQYAMAKELDPRDPTAWYYDAVRKLGDNLPVQALQDMQTAIDLNDNRAVYRSRLLLDEDLAARSASQGAIYQRLGFEQLARVEAARSLDTDPANYSAHRLLADTYVGMPRHEIARVSELLQTQLLQPMNIGPLNPGAAETNLLNFEGTGPATAAYNEFNPLFARNRIGFQASGISGSDDTRGFEAAASAQNERFSLSAGRYTYRTDGVRENNDRDETIDNVFAQYRATPRLGLQAEYRNKDGEFGDTSLLFDLDTFSPDKRRTIDEESWRVGMNFQAAPGQTFLLSVNGASLVDRTTYDSSLLTLTTETDGTQYEGQYLGQTRHMRLIAGAGYLNTQSRLSEEIDLSAFDMPPMVSHMDQDTEQSDAYLYAHFPAAKSAMVIGASYDSVKQGNQVDRNQFSPKFGITWDIAPSTIMRAAVFRTLTRPLIQHQTLEPTQVAGFNQFYDDQYGTKAWRYGLGLDFRPTPTSKSGVEVSKRDVSSVLLNGGTEELIEESSSEWSHQAYLYWTIAPSLAVSAKYRYEKFSRDYITGETNELRPVSLITHHLPLDIRFFGGNGVYSGLRAAYVKQKITSALEPSGTQSTSDNFWIVDATMGYRLPRRYGLVELSGRNLGDTSFHYQNVDPGPGVEMPSPYYPYRAWFLQAQLWF